tara:strand:+ start:441 stop:983 length:543 start_codon:yes stop_codon:yes gene_type:complete
LPECDINAGFTAILDGFSVSLKTMTEPFSIMLKLALEPDWVIPTKSDPKIGIIKLVADATVKIPPPMMFPAVVLEVEGILADGGLPLMPITLPGVGDISFGSADIPIPAVGIQMAGMISGIVFDLPIGLMQKTIALDPPTPPDFGIPDIVATIPGISPIGAEVMAGCLIERFVPLEPYKE